MEMQVTVKHAGRYVGIQGDSNHCLGFCPLSVSKQFLYIDLRTSNRVFPTPARSKEETRSKLHFFSPSIFQEKAPKSNGTLLPLPALNLLPPPKNSLGLGNCSSPWNFHLVSCTVNLPLPPPVPGLAPLSPRLLVPEPLDVKVYELASGILVRPPTGAPPAVGIPPLFRC